MAAFRRGVLFLPQFQVRCRSKVNIQRPKPRHDARRLFEAITQPVIPPEPISPVEICARNRALALENIQEENPYEEFLLKQCQKMMQENRMVAVCQALPMSAEQRKAARNKLVKKGLNLRFFNNTLMRRTVSDTALVNLSPYLIGRNMYVVSAEPRVGELVKILRKIPELILMGGRVDNCILSREGMLKCAKLPSLDIMRGELVTILGSSASRTHSLLGNHQQVLAMNLDQYIKQSQEGESPSSTSASSSSAPTSSGHVRLNPMVTGNEDVRSCLAWNYTEVLKIIHSHHCVIACLHGHDHDGSHSFDSEGIQHLVMNGVIETQPGIDAYATAFLGDRSLEIQGSGVVPSVSIPLRYFVEDEKSATV